jgi:hypothetical protein
MRHLVDAYVGIADYLTFWRNSQCIRNHAAESKFSDLSCNRQFVVAHCHKVFLSDTDYSCESRRTTGAG